jgi:outer membrane protein assembly factor BamB
VGKINFVVFVFWRIDMGFGKVMKGNVVVSGIAVAALLFAVLLGGSSFGADWPNWRGPNGNGVSDEAGWTTDWPAGGPKVLWRASLGNGFSSMAVSSGKVYAMGNVNDNDIVYCFDAATGDELWRRSYPEPKSAKNYEGGPNATPTVVDGKVYTLSKSGKVHCLDAKSGNVIWNKDLAKEFGIKSTTWGLSGSALVLGDMVVLNAGTLGIALDKNTGALKWESGKGPGGYSTPVPYTFGGKQYLALFGETTAAAVVAATGEKVWDYEWKTSYNVNAAEPIISGDTVFISSGYGKGCALLKLGAGGVSEIYNNKNMKNQVNSSVLWKGHVYGFSGNVGGKGILTCLDYATSDVKWTQKGLGTGSLIAADGKLIILGEKGKLVITEASPAGYKELASAQVLQGKCWTSPVLANGRIYARNAAGDLVCLDVGGQGQKGAAASSGGGNWARFRGPNGDGKCPETGLLTSWPEEGPPLAWTIEGLGKGFASVAIVDGKLYTMGDHGEDQFVIAIDLATRKELWRRRISAYLKHSKPGPRCTPTIDGDLLYAIGTHGDLVCLETGSGEVRWRKNFENDFGGEMMSGWKYSESPLIDGDKVVCTPGGPDAAIVALNKKTGETIWKATIPDIGSEGKDGAGYSSIVIGNGCGIKQYVQTVGRGTVGVRADNGKFLWGYNRVANDTANIPMPVIDGDYVFCTTSYETGSALLKLVADGDGIKAEELYFLGPETFENHHGGVVLLDGYIYGGDGKNKGKLTCLEMKTGKIVWKQKKQSGKGSAALLYADGHLYYRYENGLMTLVEATPEALKVKGQFMLASVTGKSWPHPVILDGKLYIRDHDVLMCYDVSSGG